MNKPHVDVQNGPGKRPAGRLANIDAGIGKGMERIRGYAREWGWTVVYAFMGFSIAAGILLRLFYPHDMARIGLRFAGIDLVVLGAIAPLLWVYFAGPRARGGASSLILFFGIAAAGSVLLGMLMAAAGVAVIPKAGAVLGALLCPPGYETLNLGSALHRYDMPGLVTEARTTAVCTGALGRFRPGASQFTAVFVAVYTAAVLLLCAVGIGVDRLTLSRGYRNLRYVLIPSIFVLTMTALYAWPAPLKAVAGAVNGALHR